MAGGVRRWLIPGAIVVVAALVSSVAVIVLAGSDPAGASVTLERAGRPGVDPFTASVTIGEIAEFPGTIRAIGVSVTAGLDADPETGGLQAEGTLPGLYGGTRNDTVCDPDQLAGFLTDNPDKAGAWADVVDIRAGEVGDYLGGLTPVVLTTDTRVTNHGFANQQATPRQSVLQTGSAVLVDNRGVPRVRCGCGNPLTQPTTTPIASTTGNPWADYQTDTVTTITPAPQPVESFEITNLTGPPEVVGAIDVGAPVRDSTLLNGELWTVTSTVRADATTVDELVRIDPETGDATVTRTTDAEIVALVAGSTDIWVLEFTPVSFGATARTGTVDAVRVDAETGQEIAAFEISASETIGPRNGPPRITLTDDGQVWVSYDASGGHVLSRIDLGSNSIAETIPVPTENYTALVSSGSSLWLGGQTLFPDLQGTLLRIDPATSAVEPVPIGDAISSLAPTNDNDGVWAAIAHENPGTPNVDRGRPRGMGRVVRISADGQADKEIPTGEAFDLAADGNLLWAVRSDSTVIRINTIDATIESVELSGPPASLIVGDGEIFTAVGTEILEITPFAAATVPVGSSGGGTTDETPAGATTPEEAAAVWIESVGLTNLGACEEIPDELFGSGSGDGMCIGSPDMISETEGHLRVGIVSTFGEDGVNLYVTREDDAVWLATKSACDSLLFYGAPTPAFLLGPDGQLQLDEAACERFVAGDGAPG